MGFKVFNQAINKEEVFFKLIPSSSGLGGVTLQAVKANGTVYPSGNILTIKANGTVLRAGGVNKNIGLAISSDGKIQMV